MHEAIYTTFTAAVKLTVFTVVDRW